MAKKDSNNNKFKSEGEQKKAAKGIINREVGEGAASNMKGKSDSPGKSGYHRSDFGGVEDPNFRVEGAYAEKDESPARAPDTNIHEVAHHSVTGELFSGHPERHGHMNKAAAAMHSETEE